MQAMNDLSLTIFIGVFSGILTSVLIWLAIQIFKKILIPWYQQSIYRGIDISGDWTSRQEFSGGVISNQTLEVNQKGHFIKGTLISHNSVPKQQEEDVKYFTLYGEIFDNYVDIEYKNRDRKNIGRGSLLLKVKNGGDTLEGALVAIDRFSTEIMASTNIKWIRKK